MTAPFTCRPGTADALIFDLVRNQNEYQLPPTLKPDDVVIDIGTHIGSFCLAALERGSHRVHGYEVDGVNYRQAADNLRPFGSRVTLVNKAVWRSDTPVDHLYFCPSADGNTGGGNVGWAETGHAVPCVPFDEAVRAATDGGTRRVRMLKIDCEGSEFAILLTAKTLHLVDAIAGEYHEFGGDYDPHEIPPPARIDGYTRFTIAELSAGLRKAGFAVTHTRPPGSHMGLFFAVREPLVTLLARKARSAGRRLARAVAGR